MADKTAIRAEAERLQAVFLAKGVQPVTLEFLQPAGTLLDLYGEDIRARAYVTFDPVHGEQMLRPDFTVPVVQMHMTDGAEPARYTYLGDVFRKQDAGSIRAREYLQLGYEVFDRANPVAADAEVFGLFAEALAGHKPQAVTGDIGLLIAAVKGLSTSERRRAALLRHIWRPGRFRALLDRFSDRGDMPATRANILEKLQNSDAAELVSAAGPEIGLRSADEVVARLDTLKEDATVAPIPEPERQAISDILALSGTVQHAAVALEEIAQAYPAIAEAVARFQARVALLPNPSEIGFEGSYGRTLMEYYDGFVFGFSLPGADIPVATGGRYDALTRVLGQGRSIPAVGGVIRPDLLVAEGAR